MKSFKQFLALALSLLIIITGLPLKSLAADKPIYLNNYTIKSESNQGTFQNDERFTVNLEFAEDGKTPISDVKINGSGNSNFKLVGDVSEKDLPFTNNTASTNFDYVYKGGSSKYLDFTVTYKNVTTGNNEKQSFSIDVYKARETKPDKEEPEKEDDKDKDIKPNISVVGGKTTIAEIGENARISLKIKNTSETSAHNISGTIETADERGIFISDSGFDDIGRLSSGSEKSMSFRVEVDQFAEEKTYPIKITFNYYNKYDKHFTNTDTIYLRVKGDGEDSQLIVDDVQYSSDNVKPGDTVWVDFSIRNLSMVPTRDVQLTIQGLETDKFTLASGTNKTTIPFFKGRSMQTVRFPIKVSRKLKSGNHGLKLQLNYKNLRGKNLEETHEFFIPLQGTNSQNSNLFIENVKIPSMIGPNQTANLNFTIRNRGQSIARDIIVKATLPEGDGLVPKSVSTIKVDNLNPGETKDVYFSFYSTKKTPTKNYPINITIESVDDLSEGDDKYKVEQFVGIFVDNPEAEEGDDKKKSVPKLIIDKYTFSSEMVEAGKKFDLKLSFFNTNSKKAVKNIKIFLTAEPNVAEGDNKPTTGSSVFTPVNSSNTFYIDSIPPKGRVQKNITMFTIPDAAAKTHVITANFEYEDAEFNEYKAVELIGVPVVQQSKLEVAELTYTSDGFVGEPASITADFYNTGKSTLYNMMVRIEGDFQTEGGTYYIGNFAPGTTDTFDGSVIPDKAGPLKGELVFSFEDSLGEQQEIRRPFNLTVSEFEGGDDLLPPEPEKTFFQKFKWIFIVLGIAILGFVGFKFYKKRKQKKEDEDLLDE